MYFNIEPLFGSVASGLGLYPNSKRWMSVLICIIVIVLKVSAKIEILFLKIIFVFNYFIIIFAKLFNQLL